MRSSGRPVPARSSTDRSEFPREARLRRYDAHLDSPWDVSGLCRSTDLEVPAPGAKASTPKAVPARAKGRCEMMPAPSPPYRVPDFCPDCREKFLAVVGWIAPALESTLSLAPPEPIITPEDTLRRAGISSERQAAYQRRMSSLLAGRGGKPAGGRLPPEEQLRPRTRNPEQARGG